VRMVQRIAERLDLPAPSRIITIEEVSTPEEIEKAMRSRRTEGKHIIPVPAVEVRRSHSRIFFNAIRIFFKKRLSIMRKADVFEKTIVRPLYATQGRVAISEQVLSQMVYHCVDEFAPSVRVTRITLLQGPPAYSMDVHLLVPYGIEIAGMLHNLQSYIISSIEGYTGVVMDRVNIIVEQLSDAGRP
jgi:uncharacterized alkaline shock family protein YloU